MVTGMVSDTGGAAGSVSSLSLTLVPGNRPVLYRRRAHGSTLDERVTATLIAYRTYVAVDGIHTEVLVEDGDGKQEFIVLRNATFMKRAKDIEPPVRANGAVRAAL